VRWTFLGATRARGALIGVAILASLALAPTMGRAQDGAAEPPAAAPAMDNAMSSAGWPQDVLIKLEREAMADVTMLPDTWDAIVREWRSFDRAGSSLGALINLGWVVLAACIALAAQWGVACGLSRRLRRRMRARTEAPTLGGLLQLLFCDIAGLGVFFGLFVYSRHALMGLGVTAGLIILAAHVLIRWRVFVLMVNLMLRTGELAARLVELYDDEAGL